MRKREPTSLEHASKLADQFKEALYVDIVSLTLNEKGEGHEQVLKQGQGYQKEGPHIQVIKVFQVLIMKTSPCNEHPLTPHFYKVKLGFTGVYIIFLFLL